MMWKRFILTHLNAMDNSSFCAQRREFLAVCCGQCIFPMGTDNWSLASLLRLNHSHMMYDKLTWTHLIDAATAAAIAVAYQPFNYCHFHFIPWNFVVFSILLIDFWLITKNEAFFESDHQIREHNYDLEKLMALTNLSWTTPLNRNYLWKWQKLMQQIQFYVQNHQVFF